jgi:hypothetical protein
MPLQLVGASAVVAAHQFNPSILSQLWLVRNGILNEGDFEPGCMFSDVIVNVISREFNLVVVPDQLQLMPKVEAASEAELIQSKLGTLIEALPHTPYQAIGLNFFWHLIPDEPAIEATTRALFALDDRAIYRDFQAEDAQFGAYLSKNIFDCRLRLDIKPVLFRNPAVGIHQSRIFFAFNYNLDLTESDPIPRMQGMLRIWDKAKGEAERIVQGAEEMQHEAR